MEIPAQTDPPPSTLGDPGGQQPAAPSLTTGLKPTSTTTRKSPDAAATGKTFVGHVETLAKLAGLAGVVTALIGLPAVHLHFARLGIPSQFIDNQLVLRAGVMPAVLLALFVAFIVSMVRQSREGHNGAPLFAIFTPLMIPTLFLLTAGLVAYITLVTWCVVWLIHWPLDAVFHIGATNRDLLHVAIVVESLFGATLLLYRYSTSFRLTTIRLLTDSWLRRLVNRFSEGAHRAEPMGGATLHVDSNPTQHSDSLQVAAAARRSEQQTTDEETKSALDWLRLIPTIWLVIPLMFLGLLYAVKAVVYFWDPTWSSYLSHELILWSALCSTVFYCLPMTAIGMDEPMNSKNARVRRLGSLEMAAALLLSYAILVTFYTAQLYPNLSGVWGGGRLVAITLWVDRAKVPSQKELTERLPKAQVSEDGTSLRVDSIHLVHSTNDIAIVVDDVTDPSGLVFPRSAILSIGWPR